MKGESTMDIRQIRIPPVAVLAVSGGAQILLPQRTPSTLRRVAAAVTGIASAGMLGASVLGFRAQGTTVNPTKPEDVSSLVTDGSHAVSRNPMYVGMVGLLCAHALWRGTWGSALPAVLFCTWIDRVQIPLEEAALHEHFGQEYLEYRSRTARWIVALN